MARAEASATALAEAPLHANLGDPGFDWPAGARACWLHAADGVRLRVAVYGTGARGTILLFPGRTEVIEKYGHLAPALMAGGFGLSAIDWRGQGLSDRAAPGLTLGHVGDFAEYQRDLAAWVAALPALGLAGPYVVLAHSMGGCIALRALVSGFAARAVAFSAPMWGLELSTLNRALGWGLSAAARAAGQGLRPVPGLGDEATLARMDFDTNLLTTDRRTFAHMQAQVRAVPELGVGGPSLGWLNAGLRETRALARLGSPALPALTGVGGLEKVVDPGAIAARMAGWPGAELVEYPGAEHEILMERPEVRDDFIARLRAHFEG